MLQPGLYEQVINTDLNRELSEIPDARKAVAPIDKAEASKVLAQYLADVVQKGLDNVLDNGGDISTQISLANKIVDLIQNTTQEADFATLSVDQRAEQLLALLREQDPRLAVGKTAADLIRPETSIAQSSLFTGAIHEPQMYTELKKEIVSADRSRLAVVDSRRWIRFLLDLLPRLDDVGFSALSELEQRMLQMFYVTVWGKAAEGWTSDEVRDNLYALSDSPVLLGELLELLRYRYEQIDFIDEPVDLGFDCPLDLHCTYTRDQLLVAMDFLKPATVREGVKWLPEKKLDVFFVTLNKADKDYSPTTMYHDYSINENLFHWQSQSTTAADSPTGQRYIHHRERGSKVLLFVREFKADRIAGGAAAYTFLGTANYVKHDGSRPMNITWRLERPIPAKFLKKTNKLVVG